MESSMEQPRLKVKDSEIGLRHVGDNVYEPKSLKVLERAVHNIPQPSGCKFFTEKPIKIDKPETYHKIQSFCFVVTENIKREGAMMLKSLRKFHDQPVYIICDKLSKRFLNKEVLIDDTVFCELTTKEDLEALTREVFEGHKCIANDIHRPAEILRKMDVMNFALQHHDNTFFLDADIIVLDKPKGLVVHPGVGNFENTLSAFKNVSCILFNVLLEAIWRLRGPTIFACLS